MITAEKPLQRKQSDPQPASSIIETRHLIISYGPTVAVDNVSLLFRKNSITALIGPSGCGKSTFLRSINRMNDIIPSARYEGDIIYEDVNLLDKNIDVTALRKEIGMVFQKPNPFAKSIYNNIAHALKFYNIKKKKKLDELVEDSLRKAALWDEVKDRLHDSAYSLSGGQQQRLCIARTLAMKPNVILLDEPSSALDPIANAKIEELIIQLKKHYTIIIVTHNMQQASRISDETAFFLNGHVIEHGETNQLFMNPVQKETEAYISGKFG
ncbi:phosphate transport system ATP-binding protein [Lentibacillus halodurans]|uniref:Phosphate transport system ATP-binding protein n=1 Tax=Lentibacillus halodurans TaxID=237679 RepID=A0A1I0V3L2_9BACI|nr:phosphate ABC transporter ATP-binding protein PstB [Lentibacillus halodurans]SFA70871.1 phosphate transport system ATP-binding protein [Lentibacillus halodurans]